MNVRQDGVLMAAVANIGKKKKKDRSSSLGLLQTWVNSRGQCVGAGSFPRVCSPALSLCRSHIRVQEGSGGEWSVATTTLTELS